MKKSLFAFLAVWYSTIARKLESTVNGKDESQPIKYLHKEMLTQELSTDLKWGSSSVDGSIVAADIVAMDSELPLKRQDSIATATGDIPKAGMKLKLTEKQLSDIDTMKAKGVALVEIVKKVFGQVKKVVFGIYERNEFIFLEGLSTGYALVEDTENVGLGIRVNYGIPDSNRNNASKPWSDPTAKIVDDIKARIKAARAKGKSLSVVMLDDVTASYIADNEQVKNNFAFAGGIATQGANVSSLDDEQLVSFFKKKFGLKLIVVDRQVTTEKNGQRTVHSPWASGIVTFLPSENVGRLVYGILAEDTRRDAAIMYEKVEYILVKKWHTNEPFSEFTSSQALCLPVIDNASGIYLLDSKISNVEDEQTEGDANFAYDGTNYTKASVVAAIKMINPTSTVTVDSKDSTLANIINKFNEEQITVFEANITPAA